MSYTFSSGAYGTGSGSATRVYGEHGIRGLDDAEEADREAYRARQNEGAEAMARTQMAASSRFAHTAAAATASSAGLGSSDNLGHFRQSVPSLSQNPRALSAASLEHLEGYKVRDLFAAHAQRTELTRAEVHKETQSELYVPRQPRLLSSADFSEFSAAAAAYAETMANTTANARAKAAARAAKLGGITGATAAGGGGGAAAVVAAATASAVAASDPLVARPLPLLPTSHDPFEVARAQATESYLQEIWSENRAKEAADERLRKHISKLVGEWSGKLARFEEEVARRQEDTYYAKFRRAENAKLAQAQALSAVAAAAASQDEKQHDHDHSDPSHSHSNGGFSSPEAAKAAALAAHRSFYSDQFSGHHKAEAWTAMLVNKKEHQDSWPMGVALGVIDAKANRVNKESQRRKKALLEHQMAHSICASTLAAPQGPSTLHALLSKQGLMAQDSYGMGSAADQTHPLTFSSFRPTTTPAERLSSGAMMGGEAGSSSDASRPGSSPGLASSSGIGKLPGIPGVVSAPPGFSVRASRAAAPFAGVPGHGHPPLNSPAVTSPFLATHVFASRSMAQAAGIAKPEALGAPSGHVLRRAEMLEAERAKLRLAAAQISVPRGTLERALVAPEIRFPDDRAGPHPSAALTTAPLAVADLPVPFFSLPENPFAAEKKGKKKGKKGKGSKKK